MSALAAFIITPILTAAIAFIAYVFVMYKFGAFNNISKKRINEINLIPDEDIELDDIPEADEEFFKKAKLNKSKK